MCCHTEEEEGVFAYLLRPLGDCPAIGQEPCVQYDRCAAFGSFVTLGGHQLEFIQSFKARCCTMHVVCSLCLHCGVRAAHVIVPSVPSQGWCTSAFIIDALFCFLPVTTLPLLPFPLHTLWFPPACPHISYGRHWRKPDRFGSIHGNYGVLIWHIMVSLF